MSVGSSSQGRAATTRVSATAACSPRVLDGTLPVWARGGFSNPRVHIAHSLSARGKLTAILWANPLLTPKPANHNNKILWVARVPDSSGASLYIRAQRMVGSTRVGRPTSRVLQGGPGPSIINMPAAGCWRFTLHWASQSDSIDLRYAANHH